jgi:hypothetical protein
MAGKGHLWVGAALVPLPPNIVRQADQRGTVRLAEKTKITVLEVYCKACRRPHEDVADAPCEALGSKTKDHLIGGPIGTRKKRTEDDDGPRVAAL